MNPFLVVLHSIEDGKNRKLSYSHQLNEVYTTRCDLKGDRKKNTSNVHDGPNDDDDKETKIHRTSSKIFGVAIGFTTISFLHEIKFRCEIRYSLCMCIIYVTERWTSERKPEQTEKEKTRRGWKLPGNHCICSLCKWGKLMLLLLCVLSFEEMCGQCKSFCWIEDADQVDDCKYERDKTW